MKKLIFRKFAKDILIFFIIMCISIGLIVWTLQAVNYFDFVTQDGHGLKTYFTYTIFNFPKIIHRIIPFIFFITLFYLITNYEQKNELSIFWINGVSKLDFTHKIIFLSVILTIFQIFLGSLLSPYSQFKARESLKNSNVDFFTSLIKEGKFINAVEGLTIFIKDKNNDQTFSNIFIDDSTKNSSKMIYAKDGVIIDDNQRKSFQLFNGKVINNEKKKINVFGFEQIDFNLADYSSTSILVPKIQEKSSKSLLTCLLMFQNRISNIQNDLQCDKSLSKEINQELFKRFYKPLYIPIIALLCCFLLLIPKNNYKYSRNKKIIFLLTFFIIIFSEASLRYSSASLTSTYIYFVIPWISFASIYVFFYKRSQNV
ncbi:LptF/LptG family permease [Candidatus Pelagibacter sp.]|nr:LptF/LptG family permease [Candidatus Pelagibacter sp.]|tara:strand:- start:67 stop:1179 length:1113 start_codon:yes stop_codon:yes gene_type:complete